MDCGRVSAEERWALMAVSDIWAITPLRQGYTLVSILLNIVSIRIHSSAWTYGLFIWDYNNEFFRRKYIIIGKFDYYKSI